MSCLFEALELLEIEHLESIAKHGVWSDYTPVQIHKAVSDEFDEYQRALIADDIHGSHGQRRELLQLANVAIKGYLRLERLHGV